MLNNPFLKYPALIDFVQIFVGIESMSGLTFQIAFVLMGVEVSSV